MKVRKRITIVADISVDENFDTDYLCVCKWQPTGVINPDLYLVWSDDFEVLEYIEHHVEELGD